MTLIRKNGSAAGSMQHRPGAAPAAQMDGTARMKQYREDGATVYCVNDPDVQIKRTCYCVFHGIDLIYNDIHAEKSLADLTADPRNLLEINHCRDGRMECCVDGESFYLAPGDISIHRLGSNDREVSIPTGHYHGITIQIDLDQSPKCMSCFLEDVDVQPEAIASKYLPPGCGYYVLRQLPAIEHIFSELYALPSTVRRGYFKVKILELFLFLEGLERMEPASEQKRLSEAQVVLAKNVCSYLTEHINQRITVAEIAEQFGVSLSRIKSCFFGVYGTSVHAYMREQRMHEAAKLLRGTDRTVLDIAGQFGYDNGSKFADAFRSVMGVTPSQYRKGFGK